jgi:UDP-N-acetylglucosamine 3-dehydrogenase
MTRVGFCGAGRVARLHAEGFRKAGATVAAFADPREASAQEIASEYGAAAYAAPEEMIAAGGLDVLCIATPHDLHVPQALLGLEAGPRRVHGQASGPHTSGGCRARGEALGVRAAAGVNHNLLFHPAVQRARQLIHEGTIGTPISAQGGRWVGSDMPPGTSAGSGTHGREAAWFDAGPHLVYVLADLLGPFADLRALPATTPSRMGGEDTVVAVGRFAGGQVASLRVSYAYVAPASDLPWPGGWRQGMEINGTEGALRFEVSRRTHRAVRTR